jgi:3-deoxy-D-manno-octulosonic-acid transferase
MAGNDKLTLGWRLYGALVVALSWLHYAVLSRFSGSDEGGVAWFRKRLHPSLPPPAPTRRRIWIHAVSAGESKVAELLRQRILERAPDLSVVLSATTYSGQARVRAVAGDDASFIMPLDTLPAQRRVVRSVKPEVLVLVESEYWPAQFEAAREAATPIVVVNATMSPRSFARHQRNPGVARRTIVHAARIWAQDESIAQRYASLGVPASRIEVTGNLKLVAASRPLPVRDGAPMVVFGNVHRGEIEGLAPAVAALRSRLPDLRVVLVPRYPGKIPGEVLSARFGPELRMVQHLADVAEAAPLAWLDEMGTLSQLYARAMIGVVCGTFSTVGGHDLAEPLHAGAASVYGPDISRQKSVHEALAALHCATQVADASELVDAVALLVADKPRREQAISAFRDVSKAAEISLDGVVADLIGRAG